MLNVIWWKKPESLYFLSPDQVRNMHNYPRLFLNSMHNKKINFFILYKDLESANENYTSNSNVPKVFRPMTQTLILAHFQWGEKEGGGYSSLSF